MNLFEATRKRATKLELLFNALRSIPPTSVEAERAFSAFMRRIVCYLTALPSE